MRVLARTDLAGMLKLLFMRAGPWAVREVMPLCPRLGAGGGKQMLTREPRG